MLGKLSKRCPISASVTSSNPIKAAKQWSSLRLSLLKKNSAQQVLPETSVAFILHSGWSLKRTVSRTRPVSVLGWPSCCFISYAGEMVKVKILMMVMSKTNSPFHRRSAPNSREP